MELFSCYKKKKKNKESERISTLKKLARGQVAKRYAVAFSRIRYKQKSYREKYEKEKEKRKRNELTPPLQQD